MFVIKVKDMSWDFFMRSTQSESTRTKRQTEDVGISNWNLFLIENLSQVSFPRLSPLRAWDQLWCGANGRNLNVHLAPAPAPQRVTFACPYSLWWFVDPPPTHSSLPLRQPQGPTAPGLPHIGSSCEGEVSVELCVAQWQASREQHLLQCNF